MTLMTEKQYVGLAIRKVVNRVSPKITTVQSEEAAKAAIKAIEDFHSEYGDDHPARMSACVRRSL